RPARVADDPCPAGFTARGQRDTRRSGEARIEIISLCNLPVEHPQQTSPTIRPHRTPPSGVLVKFRSLLGRIENSDRARLLNFRRKDGRSNLCPNIGCSKPNLKITHITIWNAISG